MARRYDRCGEMAESTSSDNIGDEFTPPSLAAALAGAQTDQFGIETFWPIRLAGQAGANSLADLRANYDRNVGERDNPAFSCLPGVDISVQFSCIVPPRISSTEIMQSQEDLQEPVTGGLEGKCEPGLVAPRTGRGFRCGWTALTPEQRRGLSMAVRPEPLRALVGQCAGVRDPHRRWPIQRAVSVQRWPVHHSVARGTTTWCARRREAGDMSDEDLARRRLRARDR